MITWLRHLNAMLQGWLEGTRETRLQQLGIATTRDTRSRFIAMPWDVGLLRVRTDRYLALAEYAQAHYYSHHRLIWPILRNRVAVINKRVTTQHFYPVRLGSVVEIHTRVNGLNDRHADFVHEFYARGRLCARTDVQVVFRKDRRSLTPFAVLPHLRND